MQQKFWGRALAAMTCACVVSAASAVYAQDTSDPSSGTLSLGGQVILRLQSSAGGMDPDQRIGVITERLDPILGVPHLIPSDVVVYVPPKTAKGNNAPVIYVLGRRLITVDDATVQAAGGGKPLVLAETWAKRLQQILPRVDWRPSNAPETIVPPHPPLKVTSDLSQVGGNVGDVRLHDRLVIRLRGPQPDGMTAVERADMLTARLNRVADKLNLSGPDPVTVTPDISPLIAAVPPPVADQPADLDLGGTAILTVDAADAKAAGVATPTALADSWAKNIRGVLGITPAVASGTPPANTPAPQATAPAPSATAAPPPAPKPAG